MPISPSGSGPDILVVPQVPRSEVRVGDNDASVPRSSGAISADAPLAVGERIRTLYGMGTVLRVAGQRATIRLDHTHEGGDIRFADGETGITVDSTGASGSDWDHRL